MSKINGQGGLGGFWAKANRKAPDSGTGAKPVSSLTGDSMAFGSAPSTRLSDFAGGPAPTFGTPKASDLVRQSKDLKALVHNALKHANGGQSVNLGNHEEAILRHIQKGLRDTNLNFEQIKSKLG